MFTGTKPGLTHHAKNCKKTGNFQLVDLTYFRCEKCGMIILTKRGISREQSLINRTSIQEKTTVISCNCGDTFTTNQALGLHRNHCVVYQEATQTTGNNNQTNTRYGRNV